MDGFVKAWAQAWRSCAPAALLALWDRADTDSYFLPADSVEPYIGHAVIGHVQRRCLNLRARSYDIANLHVRTLGLDLALAYFVVARTETADDGTLGGRVRVSLLARRHGNAWRAFHYAEAPLAPLLELQGYYERVAAEPVPA